MGARQSSVVNGLSDEQLIKRLCNLRMQGDPRDPHAGTDFVLIDEPDTRSPYFEGSALSIDAAEKWEKQLFADPKNKLALSALLSNPITSIIANKVETAVDQQTFNLTIPFEGAPVTNQRSSGRCWLFATTNVFRIAIMKKHKLGEFELSQSYLFFWDKLERSNHFLTQIIETADQDLYDREVQELLGSPIDDGGQWDMASNLVQKYGLVPQKLYPDSYSAMNSKAMDTVLKTKLREDALKLRSLATSEKISSDTLQNVKAYMMREVHTVLTLMLGPPPKPDQKFKWEYYDMDKHYRCVNKTPLEFAAELSTPSSVRILNVNFGQMFSLVNDPRHDYFTSLTVARLGNVVEGRPVTYVNVDMWTMKQAAITMLKAGLPVWFGSDVGKSSDKTTGIMDTKLYDYDLAFNITLGMTKAQRLRSRESAMTHAMVLTAVHIENGKPVRWRVMNSWGESAGEKGYFVMSDRWMDEFCYQIVSDPGHVTKEVRDVLRQKPLVLPLWDPLGALAQ